MKKIYQNFDGLDVTFQCAIPRAILQKLYAAQQEAKAERKGVLIELGKSKTQLEVAESGMKGGFAYRFSLPPEGMVWAIGDSDHAERWNVKVSAGSLMLALNGYEQTKNKILEFLITELNAIPPQNRNIPLERISRFDFCVDFILEDDFIPDPKCFLTHNRSKRRYQGKIANISAEDFIFIDQGRNIQTITIGKMPNRQITIYNKRKEITVSQKSYWWKFWGINPNKMKSNIWRVEARAGKKELNKWNLRRFSEFEAKAGDVIISMLRDYRYVTPNENDKNRGRWPMQPFWAECISSARDYLDEYICNAERKEIMDGIKEDILKRYKAHLNGVLTSYTAAQGRDISEIPGVLDGVRSDVLGAVRLNPEKFRKNYQKSEKKFQYLHENNSENK
jgi:predicted GIY-YIG superfamily endonuclease